MIKRVSIIFVICLSLFLPGLAWGILYYYSGTMDSTYEIENIYFFQVPEGLNSVTFIGTVPEEYSLTNTTQEITELEITGDGTPSVEDFTDIYDNHYKRLVWTNPTEGIFSVNMSYTVRSISDWNELITSDEFPFDSSGLPESVTTFLEPSEKVQSDESVFIDLADDITEGLTTQLEAMAAINGWVIDNISYGTNPAGIDALSTINLMYGNCSNYAHIALALTRAAGIPARFAAGFSLSKSYTLPAGTGSIYQNWGEGTHAWIEVYYPSLGWIPYDPQRDNHHVDTHRILLCRGVDSTGLTSDLFFDYGDSVPSDFPDPTIYYSLDVNWIEDSIDLSYIKATDEIDSLSTSTAVPVIQDYTITASSESGGIILPDGEIGVADGSNQTFTITPDYGYQISDVIVDGESQGALQYYTFNDLAADHTITVQFLSTGSYGSGSSCFINTISF